MSHAEHRKSAEGVAARVAVLTLSDTRKAETDKSGARIRELLLSAGHTVAHYEILPDEPELLARMLDELIDRNDVDAILTNGGTGISPRDGTIPVVQSKLTVQLSGFGELFRMLSYQEIGAAAMLSRATGGIARDTLLFAMPGSTKAVELAMTNLILPEIGHLLKELRKG